MRLSRLALFVVLLAATGATFGGTTFTDLRTERVPGDAGTISFSIRSLADVSSDPHNHDLMIGVSDDLDSRYDLFLLKDKLIVRRSFGRCLVTAFVAPHGFTVGSRHDLELTWNGPTTRLSLDGVSVPRVGLLSGDDVRNQISGIRLGRDPAFAIEDFRVSNAPRVAEDPADREFATHASCPDLAALVREPAQSVHRGVALHHFPTEASRRKIEGFLDLLPAPIAASLSHVVFVENERASKRGWNGEAIHESKTIVLKESAAGSPSTFFHEAAHLHDFSLHINFGAPEGKNKWAAISGATCYVKGLDMQAYWREFEKTHVANGILGAQGGQCASEDLAIWVGTVYEAYLAKRSLAELFDPSSLKYSDKNRKKIDFLYAKGFFSREVYDAVTAAGPR